jgi:hypothetical protein
VGMRNPHCGPGSAQDSGNATIAGVAPGAAVTSSPPLSDINNGLMVKVLTRWVNASTRGVYIGGADNISRHATDRMQVALLPDATVSSDCASPL